MEGNGEASSDGGFQSGEFLEREVPLGLESGVLSMALATKPATKFLGAFVNSCYDIYSNWLFPAASFTSMEAVDDGYAYHKKALAISHWGIATC